MKSIHGKAILIVDDDAAMLRALRKVLTFEGATVATASWAGEIMERLDEKQGRFDLIITDLRMPILNGQSVLRAVRAALPEVPVIVITAFGGPEKQAECWKGGAAAFLEKPLDTPQLLAAIDEVVSAPAPTHERSGRSLGRLWKRSIKSYSNKKRQGGRRFL
jgi:DNA-binding NtrC family response regulator